MWFDVYGSLRFCVHWLEDLLQYGDLANSSGCHFILRHAQFDWVCSVQFAFISDLLILNILSFSVNFQADFDVFHIARD